MLNKKWSVEDMRALSAAWSQLPHEGISTGSVDIGEVRDQLWESLENSIVALVGALTSCKDSVVDSLEEAGTWITTLLEMAQVNSVVLSAFK